MELDIMDDDSSSTEGFYTRQDVLCMLVRRYIQDCERKKIEGEDGEKTSGEEQMRRQIEKLSARLEKRLNELQARMMGLEKDVGDVKEDEKGLLEIEKDHYESFVEFSGRKTGENDRYEGLLDEAKLQILARMDSERIQMERVVDHKINNVMRKIEDSTLTLSTQVDKIQTMRKDPYK